MVDAVEPFFALVVYPTTPDAQASQSEHLARIAADRMRLLPGFLGARVLVSEDGESIVSLVEWSDRDSFEQFRQSEFGRAAASLAAGLHPKAYWLRLTATIVAP
jgi:heme-degrading monooxygenase HmoA